MALALERDDGGRVTAALARDGADAREDEARAAAAVDDVPERYEEGHLRDAACPISTG